MKVKKYELVRIIDKLKSVVQKNTVHPALGGVLVKEGYLIAANGEITIQVKCEDAEGESFIIPMKAFDLIKNLPEGDVELLHDDKNVVTIKMEKIKNSYQSFPAENFIYSKTDMESGEELTLPGKSFMEAISHVIYAAAEKEPSKPMLEGIYLEGCDGYINLVATDGHVLAWDRIKADGIADLKIIVPKAAAKKLLSMGMDDDVNVSYSANSAIFRTDGYVSDVAFVKESISEFLLDRLDKSNVAKLFAYYNGISNTKSRKCINDSKEFVEGTIECIAADISENIRNRTVVDHILLVTPNEPLVKYVEIVDGLSGKKRELGIEKLIFQLYETIIRDATKEMFEAKIGEYQVASIKGRGQSYGKKHIKRWISSDPEGTKYCGKADVQKCYPSMPHDKLKALLHRDLRKSDMLLYLFDTIIYLYDYANELLGRNDCLGKGILIGSPVSKDLCNYYMSYLYHYINEKLFEKTVRRGKEKLTRLVSHVMIYMDDIVVFGGNKKHIHKAMEMIVAFTRDFLGLVIKPTWQKFLVSYKTNQGKTKGRNLDFMGFVFCGMEAFYRIYDGTKKRLKRVKVIVRDSIFLRGRRKFSKLIKKIKNRRTVSKHYAMSLLAYHGWIKNTDSFQFQSSVMWKEIIGIARNIVSRSEKGKPYTCDKYYQKWRTLYA